MYGLIRTSNSDRHAIAIGATYKDSDAPTAVLDMRAKDILKAPGSSPRAEQFDASAYDVLEHLDPADVCEDLRTLVHELVALAVT